jgi:fatty-acid desaturase
VCCSFSVARWAVWVYSVWVCVVVRMYVNMWVGRKKAAHRGGTN